MPILDIQKRARELGRIRIGQVVPTSGGKTRPEKLDRFRLTSHSRELLEKVAHLYGGTVTEWQPQGGGAQAWEVITDTKRLPIMVPPQPVTQWYEFWTAGGCKHRCDGHTNVLTDELCDPDDHAHKEALQRPTTRLNVVLRDVEGIGVWRLETHGWNAAVELPDAAEFLAAAGGYVNGWVSLEPRTSKAEVVDRRTGESKIQTRHFHVPIIEIEVTPAELMAGRGRIQPAQLGAGGPVPAAAIASASSDPYAAWAQQVATADNLDRLAGLWADMVEQSLVGQHSAPTPARDAFVTAFRARAAELKPTEEPAQDEPAAAVPDADGAYEAEIVEETPTAPPAGAPEPDPDVVWQQILKAGGERGMTLPDVEDDIRTFFGGMTSAEASGAELAEYLKDLQGRPAEAGAA